MTAAERAAEVMRLARNYRSLPDYATSRAIELSYQALDTAVTALAERAYPAAGDWATRRHAAGFDYYVATVEDEDRPGTEVAKVYADPINAEIEIGYFGPITAAEARVLAARLVEAADRLDEHTAAAAVADQRAAAVTR